jgi:hypothetical protein
MLAGGRQLWVRFRDTVFLFRSDIEGGQDLGPRFCGNIP